MNGPMTPALPVTLESLAERPIWVAWAPGRRGPGETVTKVPYSPQGGKARADDPATWGTRAAAEACAARLPKPYGAGGVGLELTDLGNGLTLGGIDLDTCRTDDGTLAPWASEVVERFATYTEISPSGTGVKLFLAFDAVNLTSFRTAMGTPHGKSWKNGTGKCQRRSNSRPVWRSKSRPLVRGVMPCSQAPDRGPGCKVAPAKSVRIV